MTHFLRGGGGSAPPAARRRSEAAARSASSGGWLADGSRGGAAAASEGARGRPSPAPGPPAPVTFRARAAGAGPGGGGGGGAMFVQEEKIFAGKVLRLHICASDGAEWLEEATEDTSVEKLKERCLKHVSPPRLQASPSLAPFPCRPPTPAGRASASRPCALRFHLDDRPGGGGTSGCRRGEAKSPPERRLLCFQHPCSLLGWGS